ncbi:MAG: ComEC/Rec2 family competence protein [Clostridia bacterium]|nr:ComEC/Rec2 family competence protein [Clostridia bacterium]
MLQFIKDRPMLLSAIITSVISVIALYSEMALFVLALVILVFIFYLIYKRSRGEIIFAALLILAVTVSGFLAAGKTKMLESYDDVLIDGEFVIADTPQNYGEYYSAIFETLQSDVLSKGEKIRVTYNSGNFKFSEKIKAKLLISGIEGKVYKNSNYSQRIFLKGYIKEFENTGENDVVLSLIGSVRKHIRNIVFKNYKASEAATVMALVTGDKSYFTDDFYNNVKCAGVAHVMVVSGMHLSIIVSMFLYIINKFLYNRYLKALTIVFVTVSVMAICGFTMSILRAGITYFLMALALILNRENTSENTLGFAVCLIYLANPFAIFSVAFLLSVLSTFSILVVSIPVIEMLKERKIIKNKLLLTVFSSVIISISTLIFTAPVTIYYFGYISCVSVITNLLIANVTSYAMIFCILGFAFPILAVPFYKISELLVSYINAVINFFGTLPFSTVDTPRFTIILPILLIIMAFWVLVACKLRGDMVKLKEMEIKRVVEGGNGEYARDFGTDFKKRNKKGRKKHIHIIRR